MPIGNPDLAGTFTGTVVRRDDPENLGRVKVEVPGIIEGESAWALPEGGGAPQFGSVSVPPLGAVVYVTFVNRNENTPVYRPGWFGKPDGVSEMFPEHVHPDVHVFGMGPFRVVVDLRDPDEVQIGLSSRASRPAAAP